MASVVIVTKMTIASAAKACDSFWWRDTHRPARAGPRIDCSPLRLLMRGITGDDRERDRPQAIDVGPMVDLVEAASRLFWVHLERCPQDLSLAGSIAAASNHGIGQTFDRVVVGHLRQTLIDNNHLTKIVDHDVFWFEVAMDDLPRMGVSQRAANVDERGQQMPQ